MTEGESSTDMPKLLIAVQTQFRSSNSVTQSGLRMDARETRETRERHCKVLGNQTAGGSGVASKQYENDTAPVKDGSGLFAQGSQAFPLQTGQSSLPFLCL